MTLCSIIYIIIILIVRSNLSKKSPTHTHTYTNKLIKHEYKKSAYCPSKESGGLTENRCMSVTLLMSAIQSSTSGLRVPGVGYRTVLDAGNMPPLSRPEAVKIVADENQGYTIWPTFVSLNEAYMIWVPSREPQTAGLSKNISSGKKTRNFHWSKFINVIGESIKYSQPHTGHKELSSVLWW